MEGNDLADLRIRENLLVEDRSKKVEVSFAVEEIDERTSRLHVDVIGVVENHEFSDNPVSYTHLTLPTKRIV